MSTIKPKKKLSPGQIMAMRRRAGKKTAAKTRGDVLIPTDRRYTRKVEDYYAR